MKKLFVLVVLVIVTVVGIVIFRSFKERPEILRPANAIMDTESLLVGIKSVKTQWPKTADFSVETRHDKLTIRNCTECHQGQRVSRSADFKGRKAQSRRAHWNIKLEHAEAQIMNCKTCHSKSDVSRLQLLGGQSVEINHAYKNCRQCHSSQAKDWAGGAHGKRVKTWAGRRIVYNCTGCHNPHKPRLEKRWPKINTTLPEGH